MVPVALFTVLTILVIGWMLHTNAKDRKRFEKQLDRALDDLDDLDGFDE